MTVSRRPARVFAMQALYAMDVSSRPLHQVVGGVLESSPVEDIQRSFGMKLCDLFLQHQEVLKAELEKLAEHWAYERMPLVDRLCMMLGMVELWYIPETPAKVVLSEYAEIAKKYSTADSVGFVNGLLKAFATHHKLL